eukprot:4385572-Prymnesium_polylepis.1
MAKLEHDGILTYIALMGTHPDYRGCGYANLLFDTLVELSRSMRGSGDVQRGRMGLVEKSAYPRIPANVPADSVVALLGYDSRDRCQGRRRHVLKLARPLYVEASVQTRR